MGVNDKNAHQLRFQCHSWGTSSHTEGSGHLCQAPSVLWTQVPGPEGNGVFKMHVRDGLKPQILDQRCRRHSFKCSQHSKVFESSGQAFQPPGKLQGSAGASLHRVRVTEGGAQGVGGCLPLPLPPSPHCPRPGAGCCIYTSFHDFLTSPWLSRDGDGAIRIMWANQGVNSFTSSSQPWVSVGNRGPEREGGVSWAPSGPVAATKQGPASHWWPPMGWATWQEQWVQMRAPSGLSRPRQPGVMAVCFQGASARISHHSPLTLGQAEAATHPSSAASSCWALGVTGTSEPQHP